MKKLFLRLLFVVAVFALTSCDTLWEIQSEKAVEISFTIPQEWLQKLNKERASAQSVSRAGVYTSISITASLYNAKADKVLSEKTVNIGSNLNEIILFGKLPIVGKTVYAQVEFSHGGYKSRIEKSESIVVRKGLNRIELTFGGLAPMDIISPTVGTLVGIAGGTFIMGDADSGEADEGPERSVTLSSFYLGSTEVTEAQWEEVMGSWPGDDPADDAYGSSSNHPARYINWYNAIRFCNILSKREGLDEVYYVGDEYNDTNTDAVTDADADYEDPSVKMDITKNGYRLPTEAEWEYAAGGAKEAPTKWAGTDEEDVLGEYAVYASGGPSQVKSKKPVSDMYALYDMSGNVFEWCWDRYKSSYYQDANNSGDNTNPEGPDSIGDSVFRGSDWTTSSSKNVRLANRYTGYASNFPGNNIGFRVARSGN